MLDRYVLHKENIKMDCLLLLLITLRLMTIILGIQIHGC